jgi:hypothetical protein
VENGIVDGDERSRAWALLLLAVSATVGTLRARKDTAGGDDENVTVGEFLFELAGETALKLDSIATGGSALRAEPRRN